MKTKLLNVKKYARVQLSIKGGAEAGKVNNRQRTDAFPFENVCSALRNTKQGKALR